ncbi:hypothetical protein MYCTH_95817 [Thermothelomyces thermophilus ATCC 42464]|uniref:Uncharacterized protein n=1 Tax=Thermothelomyces thermophilus (strain ATCC 42464 / BCRC 31852 / DSM 1799) TaxID=573729 RepID=G2QKG0_THET4|nr:uncharacterized protein MYCTH_95817 [Thermothelomyces thermophilus ATCC 42464]AEO60066.1 hypothetical protein MYCTH_95817 [Thermothelomyces thermophilus ATCC 42464]
MRSQNFGCEREDWARVCGVATIRPVPRSQDETNEKPRPARFELDPLGDLSPPLRRQRGAVSTGAAPARPNNLRQAAKTRCLLGKVVRPGDCGAAQRGAAAPAPPADHLNDLGLPRYHSGGARMQPFGGYLAQPTPCVACCTRLSVQLGPPSVFRECRAGTSIPYGVLLVDSRFLWSPSLWRSSSVQGITQYVSWGV